MGVIQSGVGIPSPEQIAQLAALVLILGTGFALDRACSPKVKSNPGNPGEQAELLREFSQLPAPLQRGALSYAKRMRKSYSKEVKEA